jgi:bifunctional non-homologous end joining protein LigD
VADGELHLDLHGEKLHGRFVLVVRTRTGPSGKEDWLLLHKHDEYAVTGWDAADHRTRCPPAGPTTRSRPTRTGCGAPTPPAARASVPLRAPVVAPVEADALVELDGLPAAGAWSVFGRRLRVTNLDKVLFPRVRFRGAVPRPGR